MAVSQSVDQNIFKNRLEELGISVYELSKRVADIRNSEGEDVQHRSLINGLRRAVENPKTAKVETFLLIMKALDGELSTKWETTRQITKTEFRDEKL